MIEKIYTYEKEENYFLKKIKEDQANNLRFLIVGSYEKNIAYSIVRSSRSCEFMLHDLSKGNNPIVCFYDSKYQGQEDLEEAVCYVKESKMRLTGNVSWICNHVSENVLA